MRLCRVPRSFSLGPAAAVALVLAPCRARAFCRSTTCEGACPRDQNNCKTTGLPLYWPTSCVGFSLNEDASFDIPFPTFKAVAEKCAESWSALSCPGGAAAVAYAELAPVSCHKAEYNPDGPNANIIMFQDNRWDYTGPNNTLAKTTVSYDTATGEILDADIELNHAYNEITVGDQHVVYDLQSILTHEMGHFLGLDHSLDPDATMNANYAPGTTSLRTLSKDDVSAICAAYPPGRQAACDPTPRGGFSDPCAGDSSPGGGGCALARGRPARSFGWIAALALLAALGRGTCRRSR